ncbi:MAG: flagellar FliJ family protein [Algisphaera sp.]
MATFEFRFETVLKQRRREEERCQGAVAEQLRKQGAMRGQLSVLQDDIAESRRSLGDALTGTLDLSRVGEFTRFSAQGTLHGRQLVERLAGMEQLILVARRALIEAVRQRKALETLRDRDHVAWKIMQDRREQAALDEQAAQMWFRNKSQESRDLAREKNREVVA